MSGERASLRGDPAGQYALNDLIGKVSKNADGSFTFTGNGLVWQLVPTNALRIQNLANPVEAFDLVVDSKGIVCSIKAGGGYVWERLGYAGNGDNCVPGPPEGR